MSVTVIQESGIRGVFYRAQSIKAGKNGASSRGYST